MLGNYENWFDWDEWVSNLKFLCAHAAYKTIWIKEITGKGGRFTLADRVYGSPEDWLAEVCSIFVEGNNNYSICNIKSRTVNPGNIPGRERETSGRKKSRAEVGPNHEEFRDCLGHEPRLNL